MSWYLSYQYWWGDGLLQCSCCGSHWSHVHSSQWHHHSSLLALMKHSQCRASLPADPEPESWDTLAGAQTSWEEPLGLCLHCFALHHVFGAEGWRKKRPLPPAGYTTPGSASEMSKKTLQYWDMLFRFLVWFQKSQVPVGWLTGGWRTVTRPQAGQQRLWRSE